MTYLIVVLTQIVLSCVNPVIIGLYGGKLTSGQGLEHHPELRLVTTNIEEMYAKVSISHPQLLHPNLKTVTLRPWGAKEFALTDNQMGVRIQQW